MYPEMGLSTRSTMVEYYWPEDSLLSWDTAILFGLFVCQQFQNFQRLVREASTERRQEKRSTKDRSQGFELEGNFQGQVELL